MLGPPVALGLVLGSLAFAAALTPSLIPRGGVLQGLVAGLSFTAAYALTAGLSAIWKYLEIPVADARHQHLWLAIAAGLSAIILSVGLSQATAHQNSIHMVMGLPPVETARPATILIVAIPVVFLLISLGRIFRMIISLQANWLARFIPLRVAILIGITTASGLFWLIGNGVLARGALRLMDSAYAQVDRVIPPDFAAPTDPTKTGSSSSLVRWEDLGAEGRRRIASGPARPAIESVRGATAREPLRVYVGRNSAATVKQRAELALNELIRIDAFSRKALVIATPTGTGWIDPRAMAPVEYLLDGDLASVSVQYSYLPSWLSLLVEPEYGLETARAVFQTIYGHWRGLPVASRPKLYLFGLSLGALNSDLSVDIFDILADPFHGAFWVGPPFASRTWRQVTNQRLPGSPAWRPSYRNGSLVRFSTQIDTFNDAPAPWGPLRIAYLQYASDPITFFETKSIFRRPDWSLDPRGQDVSPEFKWFPVVTFLQLIADMMTATVAPVGYGHVYHADHYLNGWVAVLGDQNWSASDIQKICAALRDP